MFAQNFVKPDAAVRAGGRVPLTHRLWASRMLRGLKLGVKKISSFNTNIFKI